MWLTVNQTQAWMFILYDLILIMLYSAWAEKQHKHIIWRCCFTWLTCREKENEAGLFIFISHVLKTSIVRSYMIEILKVLLQNRLDYWYDIRESLENVTPESDVAQSSREDTVSLCWSHSGTLMGDVSFCLINHFWLSTDTSAHTNLTSAKFHLDFYSQNRH